MRVLVTDDAEFMRITLQKMLQKNGHDVVGFAGNGEEAFNKYKELKPDVVTMDITMPDVDGIEGTRRIKQFDPNAKIIICSAVGQERNVLEAIKAGATNFIVKPFKEEKIIEAINKIQ